MRTDLQPRFAELTDEVARLYAANFTEQELKDILAFYKTTAGKKLLTTQPKIVDCKHEVRARLGEHSFRSGGRKDAR